MTIDDRQKVHAALPMKFNLNWKVRVKLLPAGRQHVLDTGHAAWLKERDGWSEWQLWDLMSIFGPRMGIGINAMFENEIELVGDPWHATTYHAMAETGR